jgi:small-conductance mechanosensitive channel
VSPEGDSPRVMFFMVITSESKNRTAWVRTGQVYGRLALTITSLNIKSRHRYLRTDDNRLVILLNGDMFASVVISNTASPLRRREFILGIGCDNNIAEVQSIVLETLRSVEELADNIEPHGNALFKTAGTVPFHVTSNSKDTQAHHFRCFLQFFERCANGRS